MLANQIRLTTLSAANVFRVHPFLAKKHRELPFLAIAHVITTMCDGVLDYIVSGLCLLFFWCPSMAINVNVYNGGLLPDIILLAQCYFHREPV